ncbi:MAG: Sapep family Mn(2+)-dependent dipeptidase [Oscillospiraceae bacterium]|nr:Sapep family Mn(2+)-dependent dipeptidase [Oscillospiraceae bacterium]
MDEKRLADIERFVSENEDAVIRDIARLVSIPSVEGPAAEGAPFGVESRRALDCGLQIASELGLEAVNCENKIGYAAVGEDRGRGYLATITHLDVVPAGEGWPSDPFTLREQDGYLLGRGVMDDKGPSVLCLYALKYLKESGVELRYPVRALLGSNEETGMLDVEHYLEHYPAPLFCFSPDADFPLINGEKGIYHGRLVSRHTPVNVLAVNGGVAANAVPAKASATVRAGRLEPSDRVSVRETEPGIWELEAAGISGHASMPAGTVNAIALIVEYLLERGIPVEEELPYFRFIARLLQATDGSGFGLQSEDDYFTPLTAVGGKITTEDGVITQTIDCRYGITVTGEKITSALKEAAVSCADIFVDADNVPFYAALDNPAIQACIESYNLITGENARPITIGGGTYARHFPSAAAFGPEHPERPMPDFCGPIHGINEAARKSDFFEALKIYIVALLRLEALDY